ncbi:hypothetical protein ZWY2020_000294 [Hordeum vulgare]|nr:hypothetical protein ZWY2020_000294 [Hordeum vulgare]
MRRAGGGAANKYGATQRVQVAAGPSPKDGGGRLVCDACSKAVLGFHYHSSKLCLHPCCANPPDVGENKDDGRRRDQRSRSKLERTLSSTGHISDAIDTGEAIADLFSSINLDDGGSLEEPDCDFDFDF